MMNGRNVSPQPASETPYVPRGWLLHFVRGLDMTHGLWYHDIIMKVTDRLKKAIRDSGLSDRNLGFQSGVNRQSIGRFMSGQTGLSLEQLDKLAAFLGLELEPKSKAKKRKVH